MITAQDLYDWREEFEEISGTDLHALFSYLGDGDPSPAGRVVFALRDIREIAENGRPWQYGGNPGDAAEKALRHFTR